MSFRLLDAVTPRKDIPEYELCEGNIGTIVEVWEPGVFTVEFNTEGGRLLALVDLKEEQLRAPTREELQRPRPPDSEAHEYGIRKGPRPVR